jgi:8-oxoguanine deaminase
MGTLLIKNALVVATMDDERNEIRDCDILIDGRSIAQVAQTLDVGADEEIDAHNCVVIPGLVNTHNHCFQALYRAIPETQQVHFVDWITYLSTLWLRNPVSPEAVYAAARLNFAELVLTGSTTTADQHYLYPEGQPSDYVDRTIEAAREIGIRFHPARGCVTMGRSSGGLVADEFAQTEDEVLNHASDLIARYHDPEPYAMVRIVLAPLGLYSDTKEIYAEMATLARDHSGVGLHTHLHEVADEEFTRERYGLRPLVVMKDVGWLGRDVLFYHVVAPHLTDEEIDVLARSGTWVSHCPVSDLRVGYGLAQMREFFEAGVPVCFGTTGPASNSGADLLIEMKLALLVHRVRFDQPDRWLSARDILWMATRGGAAALGRDDIGAIEPGKAADLAIFDLGRLDMSGQHDPVAALLFQGSCHFTKATIVNGQIVAEDGRLVTADQEAISRDANRRAHDLTAT